MKYSYPQYPYFCGFNSVPFYSENRNETQDSFNRPPHSSTNCLKIGDFAPDFTLEGVLGGERINIDLSDQKGKWKVLFFYASDFSFV